MGNIMVCVTKQKNCERLIKYGYEVAAEKGVDLFIIHVTPFNNNFLDSDKDSEALEYLYGKALDYGAGLTVIRSNNIMESILELAKKEEVEILVLGQTGETNAQATIVEEIRRRLSDDTKMVIVPA